MEPRIDLRRVLVIALLVSPACGGASGGQRADLRLSGDGAAGDLAVATPDLAGGGFGGRTVPDPGAISDQANARDEVEPNDTPEQATPCGVMNNIHRDGVTALYLGLGGPQPGIGAGDAADWFVFRAGAGVRELGLFFCWSPAAGENRIDYTLWSVVGGKIGAELDRFDDLATDCENQGRRTVAITAGNVYAVEVRAVQGRGSYYS